MAKKKKVDETPKEQSIVEDRSKGLQISVSAQKDKGLYGESDRIKITVTLTQDGIVISQDSDWVSV